MRKRRREVDSRVELQVADKVIVHSWYAGTEFPVPPIRASLLALSDGPPAAAALFPGIPDEADRDWGPY